MSDSALPPSDKEMTLVQHLLDLKSSLTRGILAVIVVFLFLFPFANDIYTYIAEPLTRYLPEDTSMIATAVASPFLTPFKLSFVLAIYLAMPVLLYQIWRFIAPALYTHEKQLVAPILFFSSFLFYAGGAFAYYVVFPLVFGFLSTTAPEGVTVATDIAAYLDFVIKMFFAFGMAFEVPIVTVLLILTGMVKAEKLSHARPYIVVGAFVIGMLLTPPDIISQTLLAVPMWLLFEVGLIVGGYVYRKREASRIAREKAEYGDDYVPESSDDDNQSNSEKQPSQAQSAQQAAANRSVMEGPQDYSNSISDDDEDYYDDDHSTSKQKSKSVKANASHEEIEFDNRYADQVDDDLDWDDEFERIESEMMQLEREYDERKKAEKATKEKAEAEAKKSSEEEKEPEKEVHPNKETDSDASDKSAPNDSDKPKA